MNTQIMKYPIIALILLITTSSFAQIVGSHFFSDTTNGQLDYVLDYLEVEDGIILAGRQDLGNTVEPVMLKLDLNGAVIWSTFSSFQLGTSSNSGFHFEMLDDHIYAVSYEYFGWNNMEKTMWKIDPSNGQIIWTTTHPSTDNGTLDLADYDSTTFLTTGSLNGFGTLFKMEKATGDTLESVHFNSAGSSLDVAVDANKNIYYSQDYVVRKFNLDDLNQVVWTRSYNVAWNEDLFVHRMYIDHLGELYLFGRDGGSFGHGNGIYVKVDVGTGNAIWTTNASSGEVSLADFKDYNGKIYGTFRHTVVGGGTYYFRTSKVDKVTGNVDWYSYEFVTPLGSTSSTSGNGQAALSLDVDCDGDIYLTGYYGDANYGPEQWGIMKLNGNSGVPNYDLTITLDSLNYDNYSGGIAACVFGNSPVFVGHEEDTSSSYSVNPVYVTIDPMTGDVVQRKYIGLGYQASSRTLDIVNYNDSIYVFKQEGRHLVLEQYDPIGNLIWSESVADTGSLIGGHMQVVGSYLYYTATRATQDTLPPYSIQETDQIILARMDKSTGGLVDYDTMNIANTIVQLLELEVESDTSFLFYEKNGSVYFNRWTPGSFSSDQLFQAASSNVDFGGKLNIVSDYDSLRYIILGTDGIYAINKNTLAVTSLMSFAGTRNYYHILENNAMLYLAGNDAAGTQILTAVDKSSMSVSWENTYSSNGALYKTLTKGTDKLWVSGSSNDVIEVHEIDAFTGNDNWTYQTDPSTYSATMPLDFALHPTRNYLTVAGFERTGVNSGNVIIDNLDISGTNIETIVNQDDMGTLSQANTIAYLADSIMWVGGALNRITYGKEGFIHWIDYPLSTVGMDIHDLPLSITIYPNPTSSTVTIKGLKEPHRIDVFDFTGKQIHGQIANDTSTLDFSRFAPGMYIVNVTTEQHTRSLRVVKQ